MFKKKENNTKIQKNIINVFYKLQPLYKFDLTCIFAKYIGLFQIKVKNHTWCSKSYQYKIIKSVS